jgi:hypothetical protein
VSADPDWLTELIRAGWAFLAELRDAHPEHDDVVTED